MAPSEAPPADNTSADTTVPAQSPSESSKPNMNGEPNSRKPTAEPTGPDGTADNKEKVSGAELKKLAKAEKAAKRALEKQLKEQPPQQPLPLTRKGSKGTKDGSASVHPQKSNESSSAGSKAHHKRTGSTTMGGKQMPIRQNSIQTPTTQNALEMKQQQNKKSGDEKRVAVFAHLYGRPRLTTIAGADKEVHPAVLALGLQTRDYVICGSNARCVAMLLVFKRVIKSYTTPPSNSLARHLTKHLSDQISYLNSCRPLSISQGNAIRALKLQISTIDPSVPEPDAKLLLTEFIDGFIREKITLADTVIASAAAEKISDGDVVVTFAKSSIVEKTLLQAHRQGKRFRTICIDSRPLFEGKNLARSLAEEGLEVTYTLTHGISHAVKDATKVFLGAHAMMGNGRLYSRVGTALVAMMAKDRGDVPVIVCCETVKFTDKVALDSIVSNEIAPSDELVEDEPPETVTATEGATGTSAGTTKTGKGDGGGKKGKDGEGVDGDGEGAGQGQNPLKKWRDTPNLQLLNLMYDVTPAEYVDMVITEMGSLPPSAVPVVHRMSTNQ